MSDEAEKTEEVAVEEKKTEQVEEKTPEISQKAIDQQEAFDKKMDEDDGEEETPAEDDKPSDDDGSAEEKPAKDTEEDDAGKKEKPAEEQQQTAEDKEIEAAAKAIEEQAVADAGKTEAQKQAEALVVQQAADAKTAAEAEAKEAGTYVSDLDPEEWDKETIALDTKRGQQALDAQTVLQDNNAQLQAQLQQQANQSNIDFMDRKIAALGPDFHETFGNDDWADIEPGSEQDDNRHKLGARMDVLVKAYARAGKQRPTNGVLFKRAVSDVFKEIVNKPAAEKDTKEKLAARSQQVLGKGSKKASIQSKSEKALQIQTDFDKKMDEVD